ncbi:hypothetical protein CDAR_385501 [Caerostris darwini]|uniref:Uncharacterized protein n=1 Tax=Caerostris darwini TaxID=1538125 RepID=A0AAV4VQU8_9ARAC|nr:hypothetical protein CDAR_385501 [Caerostris darwini]
MEIFVDAPSCKNHMFCCTAVGKHCIMQGLQAALQGRPSASCQQAPARHLRDAPTSETNGDITRDPNKRGQQKLILQTMAIG